MLGLLLGGMCFPMDALQAGNLPWEEYDKLIQARMTLAAAGPDLFGDKVDFYSSALSFSVTDISLPGNSRLPVALTRIYSAKNWKDYSHDMPLGDWDLDLPRLSGVHAPSWPNQRCSDPGPPPTVYAGSTPYHAHEYWQGNHAHMPSGGEMLVANQGAQMPSAGGPYRWMTPGFTYFSCLPTLQLGSGPGEGFLAITPDGTRYWFNRMAQYDEPALNSPMTALPSPNPLTRKRNVLYATRVEDRFGNWVTYTYSNAANQPARLMAIQANDDRRITLTYNAQGKVATASDGTYTWIYQYAFGSLTAVILPDTRQWSIDFLGLSNARIVYFENDDPRMCGDTARVEGGGGVGTLTHPSGAVGEFEVRPIRSGRSNVPMFCVNWEYPINNPRNDIAVFPRTYRLLGLVKKRLSGPGMISQEWKYTHAALQSWIVGSGPGCNSDDCAEPVCVSDDCAGTAATTILGPDNVRTRYVFGNSYRYNEGKLLRIERGTGDSPPVRTERMEYQLAQSGQPFPTPIGSSLQSRSDGFVAEYLRPLQTSAITQDGATFSSTVNGYDLFARPLSMTKSSTLGYSKTDTTEYHDNLTGWVLGQVKKTMTGTIVTSETYYDPVTALPLWSKAFGKLQQTLTYNLTPGTPQTGTVATVSDGRDGGSVDTTIHLSDWKRGIPQQIQYPPTPDHPATYQKAGVNNSGWLDWVTDENSYKTCYTYDAMGRLIRITHPSEQQAGVCDALVWNVTTQTFAPSAEAKYGLPPGHWQQTADTGNARKVTYFDAMWRPVIEETFDNTSTATADATRSVSVKRYDGSGRLAFQSYPLRTLGDYATVTAGTHTMQYDALDRPRLVRQTSELGDLDTTIEYLPGFKRRTTNPRGIATTESFQAFDAPGYGAPLQIDAAENTLDHVRTLISRDVFGKPKDVSRGPGG